MDSEFEIIERHFNIQGGLLKKIATDDSMNVLIKILKTCYQDSMKKEETKSQLEISLSENVEIKSIIGNLENAINKLKTSEIQLLNDNTKKGIQLKERDEYISSKNTELENLTVKIRNLSHEYEYMKNDNEQTTQKINELISNLAAKNSQIINLNDEISESQKKCQKYILLNTNLENQLQSFKQQAYLSQNMGIQLNNSQIEEKMKEIQNKLNLTIEEYANKLFQKDNELDSLRIDLKCRDKHLELCQSEIKVLKQSRIETHTRIIEFNKKIYSVDNELRDKMMLLEERFSLVNKYFTGQHENTLEISKKLTEYLSVIEHLKSNVQTLILEKTSLNEELRSTKKHHQDIVSVIENKLNLTQKELCLIKEAVAHDSIQLKQSDNVLSEIMLDKQLLEHVSPVAVSTSKLLTSGYTLTDIYSEYVREHSEVSELKRTNDLATYQLKSVLRELDLIKKSLFDQERENSGLVEVNSALSKKLNDARREIISLHSRVREINDKNALLNSDLIKINRVKSDLCAQIQAFILETEQLRSQLPNSSHIKDKSADSLPTYTSISELQTVNCRLLEMIHELEAELEAIGKKQDLSNFEGDISSMSQQKPQLECKETEIKQLSGILEVTTQQRDMYRMLYQQKSGLPLSTSDDPSLHLDYLNTQELSNVEITKIKSSSFELKERMEKISQEYEEYRLNTKIEISELKSLNQKNMSEIEKFKNKIYREKNKCKMIVGNLAALTTKSQSQTDYCQNLDRAIKELNQDKQRLINDIDGIRAAHRSLILETENYKLIIKNLEIENETLNKQRAEYHPLLLQFQEISSQLTNINATYKLGATLNLNELKEQVSSFRHQLSSLNSQFITEKLATSNYLENIKRSFYEEQRKNKITSDKLTEAEKDIQNSHSREQSSLTPADLSIQLQSDYDKFKIETDNLHSQINQFKSICEASEAKIHELTSQQEYLNSKMKQEQHKWEDEKVETENIIQQLNEKNEDLQRQLMSFQIKDSSHCEEMNSEKIIEFNQTIKKLTELNSSLTQQYDNAVISHSETIKRLNEETSKSKNNRILISELKQRITQLETDVQDSNQKLGEKNKEMIESNKKWQDTQILHRKETELLHEQIVKLREHLKFLQSDFSLSQSKLEESSTCEEKSNDDVWKLLDFSRKEQSFLQARLEVSQAECARLSTKSLQLRDTITSLEKSLQTEREIRYSTINSLEDICLYKEAIENKSKLEHERNILQQQISKYEENITELKKELNLYQFNNENINEQLLNLKNSYDDIFAKNECNLREIECYAKNIAVLKQKMVSQKPNICLIDQNKELSQKYIQSQIQMEELKTKEATYKCLIAKLQQDNLQIKNILDIKIQEIEKLKEYLENNYKQTSISSPDNVTNASKDSFIKTPSEKLPTHIKEKWEPLKKNPIIPITTSNVDAKNQPPIPRSVRRLKEKIIPLSKSQLSTTKQASIDQISTSNEGETISQTQGFSSFDTSSLNLKTAQVQSDLCSISSALDKSNISKSEIKSTCVSNVGVSSGPSYSLSRKNIKPQLLSTMAPTSLIEPPDSNKLNIILNDTSLSVKTDSTISPIINEEFLIDPLTTKIKRTTSCDPGSIVELSLELGEIIEECPQKKFKEIEFVPKTEQVSIEEINSQISAEPEITTNISECTDTNQETEIKSQSLSINTAFLAQPSSIDLEDVSLQGVNSLTNIVLSEGSTQTNIDPLSEDINKSETKFIEECKEPLDNQ
ncbi:hypothetical protein HZS_2246 [Henneguya salminicola]|nr:hypothetical protein HZS_2246 [Henneguya salminicola]